MSWKPTTHKPLVPLVQHKRLDSLPPRILRFRLRLDKFDYTIYHLPGKELYAADFLSSAPLAKVNSVNLELQEEVEAFVGAVTQQTEENHLEDQVYLQVMQFCTIEWPSKKDLNTDLIPY